MPKLDWHVEGTMEHAQHAALIKALEEGGGNIARAASRLRIGRSTMYRLMRKYGIAIQVKLPEQGSKLREQSKLAAPSQPVDNQILFDGTNFLLVKR